MATRKRSTADMPMLGALMGGIAGAVNGFRLGTDLDTEQRADTEPAAAVTRPGAAEGTRQPGAQEGAVDDAAARYWRPQPEAPDVSWLARVNADMERRRQAGRQRTMV